MQMWPHKSSRDGMLVLSIIGAAYVASRMPQSAADGALRSTTAQKHIVKLHGSTGTGSGANQRLRLERRILYEKTVLFVSYPFLLCVYT